jgi:hypothetical protein
VLQAPKVELASRDGTILSTQTNDKLSQIAKITGLNFQRFTKSMLLAQGGFAAFLNASANERADLLEELTGTEIYGDISRRVFEQSRDAKHLLDQLKARADGMALLTAEQRAELQLKALTSTNSWMTCRPSTGSRRRSASGGSIWVSVRRKPKLQKSSWGRPRLHWKQQRQNSSASPPANPPKP